MYIFYKKIAVNASLIDPVLSDTHANLCLPSRYTRTLLHMLKVFNWGSVQVAYLIWPTLLCTSSILLSLGLSTGPLAVREGRSW